MISDKVIEKIDPIQKRSVPAEIIAQIRKLIDTGVILPGDRLPSERTFSKMLDVSRASLREALRALNLLGVLENRPGSGTYLSSTSDPGNIDPLSIVLSIKKGALADILEARQGLEGMIAGLAAQRRTTEDLEAMRAALEKMRLSLEEPDIYSEYELIFHRRIIDAARNRILADLMTKIYRLLVETRNGIRHYGDDSKAFVRADYLTHEQLFALIEAGDPNQATKAMVDHHLIFKKSLPEQ